MADLTTNVNYMQPTGFKIVINRVHFPNIAFFATSVVHPDMNLQSNVVAYKRVDQRLAGDKLEFGDLSMNLIMDEDMLAYQELYDWMTSLVDNARKPQHLKNDTQTPIEADISLITMSSHNNGQKRFIYKDAVPTSLGNISFETAAGDQFLTFPVSFSFSYFEIA